MTPFLLVSEEEMWLFSNALVNVSKKFHARDLKGSKIRIRALVWLDFLALIFKG